jgi:hypothetical protein
VTFDRADVMATAILQIMAQCRSQNELRQALVSYLRDELADVVRQTQTEIRPKDE